MSILVTLTPTILSRFSPIPSNSSSTNQPGLKFGHVYHVVLNSNPEGFYVLGSSEHRALQGIWKRGRVLAYQGHVEFDKFVNREKLKFFSKCSCHVIMSREAHTKAGPPCI